jgi:hypothetical protein
MLTAIPTIERAIAVVAIQPIQKSHPSTISFPITLSFRTNSMRSTITGGASTPLMTALQ